MKPDFDIIFALLRSIHSDESPLLAEFTPTAVATQRELLLEDGFATGNTTAPERKGREPLAWDYSRIFLSDTGTRLRELSADQSLWQRAQEMFELTESPWSLADVYIFLDEQSDANRNA
jgi:hypothetical protein